MTGDTHMRWAVAGGGTGGHVTPALALGERIAERGDAVLFLGSERGLEARLVPEAGFELVQLPAAQVMGRSLPARAGAVLSIARSALGARRALRRFGADVVVSVGGYASVPAVAAAALARLPIALVEPNAIPGRANRLAARFAGRIFLQFDEAAAAFGAAAAPRIRTPGIPLRRALVQAFAQQAPREPAGAVLHLLVFGGSQGARQINEAMIEAAPGLDPAAVEVFHQTGEADRERVAAAYAGSGLRAEVVAFERDMPRRYRWADLALCRSGALTVAELTMAGLPALLVPYPHAADDHQAANARALERAGAARVLDPHALTGGDVAEAVRALAAEPDALGRMADRAAKLARPDAAERVIDECAALVAEAGR